MLISMGEIPSGDPEDFCPVTLLFLEVYLTITYSFTVNSNWEPLMRASHKCGFSVVVHPEGVVISVRYAPCLEKKVQLSL